MLPKYEKYYSQLGQNFKLARLRRKLTIQQVAERTNLSESAIRGMEEGHKIIKLEDWFAYLIILNLADDLLKLAGDDILGRKLQDIELLNNENISA